MKIWLSTRGPLIACFTVFDDFYSYRSGVYRHVWGNIVGGHCISIIGYDDANGCWLCKNSWGAGWGESGFFRIGYGEGGIELWQVYAVDGVEPLKTWVSLGGELASDPAVGINTDGRTELFAKGSDNHLWHRWQLTWQGWASLGGSLASAPAVATNSDGQLEVFARGTNNTLWHRWQQTPNGDWAMWSSLGGGLASHPAPILNGNGVVDVFVRGTNSALWHRWQLAAGQGWSA